MSIGLSSTISSIPGLPSADIRMPDAIRPSGDAGDFSSMLSNAIGGVERLNSDAGKSVERFLAGDGEEVHTVALATQRAELAFEMFLQVRNKVVSAYQSVMQMQV
jgi:flagellar hook-basal body complex protein FliE